MAGKKAVYLVGFFFSNTMNGNKCNIKPKNVYTKGKLPPIFREDGVRVYRIGEKGSGIGRSDKFVQDFETLRDELLKKQMLFEDPDFPADDSSLKMADSSEDFQWLRPSEIAQNPKFFAQGVSRFDVQQGALGDCWVLAAVANLTMHKKLFYQVVPDDQSFEWGYAGIFHFRFWQYDKWVDVVVDDRLPTIDGNLAFLKSSAKNEFWSALMEKAYAKLHGSYGALAGGISCEAVEDFTGGVTEIFTIKEKNMDLFSILLHSYQRNSMIGCSFHSCPRLIDGVTPEGLVKSHAYSITKVCFVKIETNGKTEEIPMLRLRNPWGDNTEWSGAWSDKSKEWKLVSEQEKKRIGFALAEDGEFWMSYDDFLNNFTNMEICNLNPGSTEISDVPEGCVKVWDTKAFHGEWVKGVSAGGCSNHTSTFWQNPQYSLVLEEPDEGDDLCTVIVALMQKNRRSYEMGGVNNLSIGFGIYKHNPDDPKPLPSSHLTQRNLVAKVPIYDRLRESSHRFKLPPGSYCIIPTTFKPNDEGNFLLRVFTGKTCIVEEYDEDIGFIEPDLSIQNVKKIEEKDLKIVFDVFSRGNKEIDWAMLKVILEKSLSIDFSNDACRSMVAMLDIDESGNLGYEEFKILCNELEKWETVFEKYSDGNDKRILTSQLRDVFRSGGFTLNNRILNILAQRYSNYDDFIELNDFITCAMRLTTMIDNFIQKMSSPNSFCANFDMEEWIRWTVYS